MKKIILVPGLLLILFIAWIYLFIPQEIVESRKVGASVGTATRGLLLEKKWPSWLNSSGTAQDYAFQVRAALLRELNIEISGKGRVFGSRLYLIPEPLDSISLKWQCTLQPGLNPFSRLASYWQTPVLKKEMGAALDRLRSILENPEMVYGFPISRRIVTDTVLIATRENFTHRPSTKEYYSMIDALRAYTRQQGAEETGYPMVHTDTLAPAEYTTMIALPVNRRLPEKGKFIFKKMVRGFILVAPVRGGEGRVREAFAGVENYMADNQKQKIAIAFESLVTDRRAVSDTSQWQSNIYVPIVK